MPSAAEIIASQEAERDKAEAQAKVREEVRAAAARGRNSGIHHEDVKAAFDGHETTGAR